MSFYIKSISAYGSGKETSVINLQKGLNIIYGPSNTGKTYVINTIDYLFGSKNEPIDNLSGYTKVAMEIVTDNDCYVKLERKIGENKISVVTDVPSIESKEYNLKAIGEVLLSLIGINEEIRVIKSQDFKTQTLTWKTIRNMFLVDEQRISANNSIVVSQGFNNITAALSSLLFLINGKKQSVSDEQESRAIKEAKKSAVTKYIRDQIASFVDTKKELENELQMDNDNDIEAEIERIMSDIESTDNKIREAMARAQIILNEIFEVSSLIEEGEFLSERYRALESQYISDIKRLEFIINGESKQLNVPKNNKCPFCDSAIKEHSHHSYTNASKGEIDRINLMLNDLRETMHALDIELEKNNQRLFELESEDTEIKNLINVELKPHIDELKHSLKTYTDRQQFIGEIRRLSMFAEKMSLDIQNVENEESSLFKYEVKNCFEEETINTLNQYLDDALKSCCFPNYLTSKINMSCFDVTVNTRDKRIEGQGYKSFINTIFAFVLMKYLSINALHAPKLLILDSPIMALTESESNNAESMKSALFSYLDKNQHYGQILIAENEIPDINYDNVNLIEFSGLNEKGRFGFLKTPN